MFGNGARTGRGLRTGGVAHKKPTPPGLFQTKAKTLAPLSVLELKMVWLTAAELGCIRPVLEKVPREPFVGGV